MKSIRNVDVLYTIHEKSRVLEECICRVESACDTGHFESVDSALRTKPELRAALGTYIRQMLALLGDAAGTPKAAFEMLTDVDLQLPMVKNEAGEEVRLTAGTFPVFRESRDRSVREGAFRAMFGTYRQFGDAIATLYGGSVKFDTYFSNQRGYASACEAALDGGNVPVSVYDSLIEAALHAQISGAAPPRAQARQNRRV